VNTRQAVERARAHSRIVAGADAEVGQRAIEWARRRSPVLDGFVREQLTDGRLAGRRVAVVVHLEAKTALLATILADAGAEVVVAGSNPFTTRDEVAAALVERGIEVHSSRRSSAEQWEADLAAVAASGPQLVIDDGAELTVRIARDHPDVLAGLWGVTEETTTGVARLVTMAEHGQLPMAAVAANDAACKHLFDNRYGTGQSTVQAILALTNLRLPGRRVVVIGYGWVGRGIATYVKALGGRVTVMEVDAVRALEAHMDGHEVADARSALPWAELIITATGGVHAVGAGHLDLLAANVVVANAGHHDREIDVDALEARAVATEEVRAGVTRYRLDAGRDVHVLSGGALVNIAGGWGHPIEIMDLSFSVQALACHWLAARELEAGVIHQFPAVLDRSIAAAKLASRGIHLDDLHDDQTDTLRGLFMPPDSGRPQQDAP